MRTVDEIKINDTSLRELLDKHNKWLNGEEGGVRIDLSEANLRWADLDFACWPLWCGSKNVKVDARIASQLAAHYLTATMKNTKRRVSLFLSSQRRATER